MTAFFRNSIALSVLLLTFLSSHYSYGQTDKESIDSINALVQKLSSDTEKVKTLIDKSSAMYCEDSITKIHIAIEARQLAENIDWRDGVYNATRNLGQIYFICSKNITKAAAYFQENVDLARKLHDTLNQGFALETIAKFYVDLHQYDKSLDYYTQVLKLKTELNQPNILGNIGAVYDEVGDYAHALSYYDSALHLVSLIARSRKVNLQDTIMKAGLLLDVGDIYLATTNADKAADNYKQVRDIGNAINDPKLLIWSLTGISKTYKLKKDYKNAIGIYQNALAECNAIHYFRGVIMIQNELSDTYSETWDLKMALAYADSARKLAEDQKYVDLLPKAYVSLGNIYLKQNKYDLAINNLQEALIISQQTNVLEDERDALNSLSEAYKDNGQWSEALTAYKNYISIRDSMYNIVISNKLTRKELEISFKDNEEIEQMKQEGIYDKKIERQKILTYCVSAGLALVLLLAFFIYRNYNTQKKYNKLLSKEKKRHLEHIEAQSNVLSDIAHTQAHDVRGPVATILGLVQVFNYDDPADPMNKQVMEWIGATTEKLDTVVKEVIIKENKLRSDQRKKGDS